MIFYRDCKSELDEKMFVTFYEPFAYFSLDLMTLSLPWKLVVLHSALIVLFMFTLWNRWFLTDIPFDSFYAPFFFTSGPLVYFIAQLSPALVGAVLSQSRLRVPAVGHCSWSRLLDSRRMQWWCIGRLWLLVSDEGAWDTRGLTSR